MKQIVLVAFVSIIFIACGKKVTRNESPNPANRQLVDKKDNGSPLVEEKPVKQVEIISEILKGEGAPSDDLGKDNDLYIDTLNGEIFVKKEVWILTEKIEPGAIRVEIVTDLTKIENPQAQVLYVNSIDQTLHVFQEGRLQLLADLYEIFGNRVFSGVTPAEKSLGRDGDVYLNTATNENFLKVEGEWTKTCEMGANNHFCGEAAPTNDLGKTGDIYVQSNGKVFKKAKNVWVLIDEIKIKVVKTKDIAAEEFLKTDTVYVNEELQQGYIFDGKTVVPLFEVTEKPVRIERVESKEKIERPELGVLYIVGRDESGFVFNGQELVLVFKQRGEHIVFGGSKMPDAETGINGDHFYHVVENRYYVKQNDQWQSLCSLGRGAFLCGDEPPKSDLGEDGNRYLQSNGSIFQKRDGQWRELKEARIEVQNVTSSSEITDPRGDVLYIDAGKGEGYIFDGAQIVTVFRPKKDLRNVVIRGDKLPAEKGREGDIFINIQTNESFLKTAQGWLPTCESGRNGFYCGKIAPGAELGKNDDIYVDEASSVYQKQMGQWVKLNDIQFQFEVVKNLPETDVAKTNTLYFNVVLQQGYVFDGRKYLLVLDASKFAGNVVHKGDQHPESELGKDGDFHLNLQTGKYLIKQEGQWTSLCRLNGLGYLCGADVPVREMGQNGDTYLRHNGDVYRKSSGNWVLMSIHKPGAGRTVVIQERILSITADSNQATELNLHRFVLPYLSETGNSDVRVSNLINQQTNHDVKGEEVVKNGQVIVQFNIAQMGANLSGRLEVAELSLDVRKFYLDDKYNTEMICLLNNRTCSGRSYVRESKFHYLLNPEFYEGNPSALVNRKFVTQLNEQGLKSEFGDSMSFREKVDLLDTLDMSSEQLKDVILEDGILTFVLADDMQVMTTPILKLEFSNRLEASQN